MNKEVTNEKLTDAIKAYRKNATAETQDKMFDELLKAELLNPAIIEDEQKKDQTVNFCMINNNKNELYFLAFTDKNEMKKWQKDENQKTVLMTFRNYADMLLNGKTAAKGFVINPYSPDTMAFFTKETIKTITKTFLSDQLKNEKLKNDEIEIKTLDKIPADLCNALITHAQNETGIKAMYLTMMKRENSDSLLLIVDYSGDRNKILGSLGQTASYHLSSMLLNILEYDTSFAKDVTRNLKPFYEKNKAADFYH